MRIDDHLLAFPVLAPARSRTGDFLCIAFPSLLLLVCLPWRVQAEKPAAPIDANGLVGLWGSDRFFGPEVRGVLMVVKRAPDWRASIGGYSVPMELKAGAA